MLATTDLPVTAVALAVGYQTPSSFAASFRKLTGTTPTVFRKAI
jgi:AraC family transcriptional regulator